MKIRTSLLACIVLVVGCQGVTTNEIETRNWTLGYKETLAVRSEPTGARVYANGEYAGVAPTDINLDAGELEVTQTGSYQLIGHFVTTERTDTEWSDSLRGRIGTSTFRIEAHKDGYRKATETYQLSSSSPSFVSAIRRLKPDGGRLPSIVYGESALVLTLTPLAPPVPPPAPPAQQQQQQQQQVVVIGEGGTVSTPANKGSIAISSTPAAAEVYIDGGFVATTPCTLQLDAGNHEIEVRKSGYQSFKRDLRVLAGSQVSIQAELVR